MDFRDEYKKEISEISPDEAALERIRSGVSKRLAEPETAKKKPLPLRRIAVIGGSIAACLVIGVTAVVITGSGRNLADKMNNMTINAPTASASGGNMAGGANAAPNPDMSSRPNFDDVNGADYTDQGGMTNIEGVTSNDGYGDTVGEFSPDTSVPGCTAAECGEHEPSSTAAARITLDDDMLILERNEETTVYIAHSDNDSMSKNSEADEFNGCELPNGSAELIEFISSDGGKMLLKLCGDEAVLFGSENEVLGIYVKTE